MSSPPVSGDSSQLRVHTHNAFTSGARARQLSSDIKLVSTMFFSSRDKHSCSVPPRPQTAWTLDSRLHCLHASHVAAGTQLAPSKAVDSPVTCDAVMSPSAGPRPPTRNDEPAAIMVGEAPGSHEDAVPAGHQGLTGSRAPRTFSVHHKQPQALHRKGALWYRACRLSLSMEMSAH